MSAYAGDVAALARKDLLLELRGRDTLPAMLLFVVSVLTIFHFALPSGSSERAETGLLWIAIVFTALLGLTRAFAAEREGGVLDGLVLAELVALPAFALFFHSLSWELLAAVALADIGIAAIGTLLAAIAAASRARELLLPLLFLPLAIPVVIGGVGASIASNPGSFLGFLILYDGVFAILCWASFEYVVTE